MKRLSSSILAFMVIWMSTWMVTDIHDLVNIETHHYVSVNAIEHAQSLSDHDASAEIHHSSCGVCSYDHGGHMGQTLTARPLVAKTILVKNTVNFPSTSEVWHSRNTVPKIRPPIV